MSKLRVINLKEIEDRAPSCDLSPGLQVRVADVALDLLQSGLSQYSFASDYQLPFGFTHARQEQVYVVVAGSVTVKLAEETVKLGPWDAVRVAKDSMRSAQAGPDGAEVLSFGAPHSRWEEELDLEHGWQPAEPEAELEQRSTEPVSV